MAHRHERCLARSPPGVDHYHGMPAPHLDPVAQRFDMRLAVQFVLNERVLWCCLQLRGGEAVNPGPGRRRWRPRWVEPQLGDRMESLYVYRPPGRGDRVRTDGLSPARTTPPGSGPRARRRWGSALLPVGGARRRAAARTARWHDLVPAVAIPGLSSNPTTRTLWRHLPTVHPLNRAHTAS